MDVLRQADELLQVANQATRSIVVQIAETLQRLREIRQLTCSRWIGREVRATVVGIVDDDDLRVAGGK